MDAEGNPANPLATELGKKLYRYLVVGRLLKNRYDLTTGFLHIKTQLYLFDPRQSP